MKLILQTTVKGLGVKGQQVKVANGYARNYLLPRGMAVVATGGNLRTLEQQKKRWERDAIENRKSAEELAQRIQEATCTIARLAGEKDQLFGSVTATDIASALAEKSINIEQHSVQLDTPIKEIGTFKIPIQLQSDIVSTLKVEVIRDQTA